MSYGHKSTSQYGRKALPKRSPSNIVNSALNSSLHQSLSASQQISPQLSVAIQSNISGLTLFLSKFLSGMNNIIISPVKNGRGYSVRHKKQKSGADTFEIRVPHWQTYSLPLDDSDKYRIYRNGVWHEAMHVKYTPDEVFGFGIDTSKDPTTAEAIKEPLAHDMINIIEDRRIEDLGEEEWKGAKGERIFANGYAFTRRMDCGEFFDIYLKQHYDPTKGEYKFPADRATQTAIRTRIGNMRHEAFLQRLLVKKIKGFDNLPRSEYEKIDGEAKRVEAELKKIESFQNDLTKRQKIFVVLANLSLQTIRNLELQWYTPKLNSFGESSWDQSFESTEVKPGDKEKTRAGIDDYFDEITAVEVVCADCGKHYTKKLGVRV